ncbi:histidine triad (HIT) protein [Desulfofarcimen acetoxidans DSM 771]|uniref:Histidine triad (HIT) protein n=1 Tax=Desulfofarcimen acetoxidans (strain ATCC 49208 / DSM 771 / KCTC 5769 / VKM B-1644 / 5575) TaxID=485916 RepID=C8W1C2_DESAS|nr:HIT family protein [Desulfofarcimen acetoxidans]ACV61567.1 histidine triad (HIT) protein [Desulfofarcimen acetoxidans DSM 771]
MDCAFCNVKENILQNELAFAIYDKYPVTSGHMLLIPFRHFSGYFEATLEEREALHGLLSVCKEFLDAKYRPDGYNIGVNCGAAAGQTIWHMHMHLIPRYFGDIENPAGGVRGVIPDKRIY